MSEQFFFGGTHLHKLFFLPNSNNNMSVFNSAKYGIEQIERSIPKHHAILTIDVLFIDEMGQVSAQQIAIIEIILRYFRKSQIAFGGVLIIGTMDPTQIQPINQLPFLTSTMVLTCFQAVELIHSVRAHGDPDFQRLQTLTRMDPFVLKQDIELKDEFFNLANKILTYVPNSEDNHIHPNMMRVFSRKRPAQEALNDYRDSIILQLSTDNIPFRISNSRDSQRTRGSNAEYGIATDASIQALNKELKEPSEIVFFRGGIYECTINEKNGKYSQSQLAFLLDLPSQQSLDRFHAIKMWISPAGTQNIPFNHNDLPSRDLLEELKWVELSIGVAPERVVIVRGGLQAKRLQYSLKHIGAITINKSQGETLPLGIAIEITEQYSPWGKGQIVVLLS